MQNKTLFFSILLFSVLFLISLSVVSADREYVVITTLDFEECAQDICQYKSERGKWNDRANLTTHYELLTNITTNSSFWNNSYWDTSDETHSTNDTQTIIRNYINYTHHNQSTDYILLIGGLSDIPARSWSRGYGETVRSDTYYMKINDSQWSSYHLDIPVGRIPCSSSSKFNTWFEKLQSYENATDFIWSNSITLFGEAWANAQIESMALSLYNYQVNKLKGNEFESWGSLGFNISGKHSAQFASYVAGHGPYYANQEHYANNKHPFFDINCGCSSGSYSRSDWQNNLFSSSNQLVGFSAAENTAAADAMDFTKKTILHAMTYQSGTFGKSIGDAFIDAFNQYNKRYAYDNNLFADPESQTFINITKRNSVNAWIDTERTSAWNGPYDYYFGVGSSHSNHGTPFYTNNTIVGTANGTSFSNYTLRIGWWENYTFAQGYYLASDNYLELDGSIEKFEPDYWQYDCFEINNKSLPVNNSVVGTLNFSKINTTKKGIYVIEIIVSSTDGANTTDRRYFTGHGWGQGIIAYANGSQVPIETPVNITIDDAEIENVTTYTTEKDGNTGYYNFSIWEMNPTPTHKDTARYITIESLGCSKQQEYYLGAPQGWLEWYDGSRVFPEPYDDGTFESSSTLTPYQYNLTVSTELPNITNLQNTTSKEWVNISYDVDQNYTSNRLRYSLNSDLSLNTTIWYNATTSNDANISFNITGLDPHTTYYYQIYTESGFNSSLTNTTPIQSFTTDNYETLITNPYPANGSTDVLTTVGTVRFTVTSPDGDTVDFTIESSPNFGSWSANGDDNGTKSVYFSNLDLSTTYTWWVNCTDSYNWTNKTYSFTTVDNNPAIISEVTPANNSTGVSISLSSLQCNISDVEEQSMAYNITTNLTGTWTSLQGASGVSDGVISASLASLTPLSYNTTYYWNVSVTDGMNWTNASYSFTTGTAPADDDGDDDGGGGGGFIPPTTDPDDTTPTDTDDTPSVPGFEVITLFIGISILIGIARSNRKKRGKQ